MPDTSTNIDDPATALFRLPGGYRDRAGQLHREVVLRPLTGREEALLADRLLSTSVPAVVTSLLTRSIRRLGPFEPIGVDLVRDLLVADREYLILKLRQITFGNQVQAILVCPACSQKMDVDFELDQVPIEVRRPDALTETFELSPAAAFTDAAGTAHRVVEFRLPTGADQEALAELAGASEAHGLTVLLARCLQRIGEIAAIDGSVVAGLSPLARREIEERMERVAPQVELEMDLTCPECAHAFVQLFDLAALFCAEARLRSQQLYREVHRLARHYHWSEAEILALTRAKRRTYLDLIRADVAPGTATMEP